MKTWKKMLLISLVLALLSAPLAPTAYAWKSTAHVYAANLAIQDALDDGMVTIPPFGDYAVDSELLAALRTEEGIKAYRAGAIGPDGFPDLIAGQQTTHPGAEGEPGLWETDDWLWHLWRMVHFDPMMGINDWVEFWKLFAGQSMIEFEDAPSLADSHEGLELGSPSEQERRLALAFVHGYLAHASGDMFGHTWVNHYADGVFNFAEPEVIAKHIVLEGYVDKHVPVENEVEIALPDWIPEEIRRDLPPLKAPANLVIDAPNRFVYMNLGFGRGVTDQYDQRVATTHLVILWEWEQRVRQWWYDVRDAVDGPLYNFLEEVGLDFVDDHFADWVEEIQLARVRYIEAAELANLYALAGKLDAVPKIYEAWWTEYGKPATGIPDWLNLDIVPPDIVLPDFVKDIFCWIAGSDTCQYLEDYKEWVKQPESHIDELWYDGFHKEIQRQMGVPETEDAMPMGGEPEPLQWGGFTPLYNTVMLIKLTMLPPAELNRLFRDAGVQSTLYGPDPFGDPYHFPGKVPNALLGAMRSLDGCEQWQEYDWENRHFGFGFGERENPYGQTIKTGFRFWQDCEVREKVFLKIFKGMEIFNEEFAIHAPIPMQASAGPDVYTMSTSGEPVEIQLQGWACGGTGNLEYNWSAPGVTFSEANTLTSSADFPIGETEATLTVRDRDTGNQMEDTMTVHVWGGSDRVHLEEGIISFTYTPDRDVALVADPTDLGGKYAELLVVDPREGPDSEVVTCRRLLCESQACPPGENRTPCILRQGETRRIDIIPMGYLFSGYLNLSLVDASEVEMPEEDVVAGPFVFDLQEGEKETYNFQAAEDGYLTTKLTWTGGNDDAILEVWVYDDQNTEVGGGVADALMVQQEMASGMPATTLVPWQASAGQSFRVEVKSTGSHWIGVLNIVAAPPGAGDQEPPNWLNNPGAEEGTDGWMLANGTFTIRTENPDPYGGSQYFMASTSDEAYAEMYQDIAVETYADEIDAGQVTAEVGGWLNSWPDDNDQARLQVEYRSDDGTVLDSFDTGWQNVDQWTRYADDSRLLPQGTRTIRVILSGQRQGGSNNDAYFDDLFVHLWVSGNPVAPGGTGAPTPPMQPPAAPNQLTEGTPVDVNVSMGPGAQYTIVVPRNGDMSVKLEVISGDMMGISLVVGDESYVSMYFASPEGDETLVADVSGVNEGQVYLVEVMTTMGSASGTLRFDISSPTAGAAAGALPVWLWAVLALVVLALAGGVWWQRRRKRISG